MQLTAEGAVLAYQLGELGIGPRVHAAWIEDGVCTMANRAALRANPLLAYESSHTKCGAATSSKFKIYSVSEPFVPLPTLLRLVNGSQSALRGASGLSLEEELVGHVRQIAELGLLFLDTHAGNVLVRPAGYTRHHLAAQAWESRLTDFDRQSGDNLRSRLIIPAPGLNADCRQALMLTTMALSISCRKNEGPRAAFQSESGRLAALPTVWGDGCADALGFVGLPSVTERLPPRLNSAGAAHDELKHFGYHTPIMIKSECQHYFGGTPIGFAAPDGTSSLSIFAALQRRWESGLPPL